MVNPSSETCLLNLKDQFGIQTKRPIHCYGSLVFILQENERLRQRENFEMEIYLRNERERKLVEAYEQRVRELQSELDLDQNTFQAKLIAKLQADVA